MDKILIAQKLESLRRCLQRVHDKCPAQSELLANDPDLQDIVVLNLTRAIQLSVDIASHILSQSQEPVPPTMGEAFSALEHMKILDQTTASALKRAVGFRNIAVHNYEVVNWQVVYALCQDQLQVFKVFAERVAAYCELAH
jgi:uncharacterized protein YutE (UPF0331/DUF86 family)